MRSCAILLVLLTTTTHAADVTVSLTRDSEQRQCFEIRGLPPPVLQQLRTLRGETDWARLFAVYVGDGDRANKPPMLGEHSVEGDALRFRPRFPLQAGLNYVAVFTDPRDKGAKPLVREFMVPAATAAEPTRVVHVYPTRDVLPENQLKFYLHFTAPMSQGDSYRHLHLVESSGREVDLPFLELGEELWDETGTRLTVFFDPGRIKRGLKPREEVGPSLEEGKKYTLVIDRDWPDATGRPLAEAFRKPFRVIAPDDTQPASKRWKLIPPKAGSTDPLVVEFDEPLDHAMLERVLTVHRPDGSRVAGKITVDREETRWQFQPEQPWSAGRDELVIDTTLEDLAGNSIGRPFEVDVQRTIERQITTETVTVPFEVR